MSNNFFKFLRKYFKVIELKLMVFIFRADLGIEIIPLVNNRAIFSIQSRLLYILLQKDARKDLMFTKFFLRYFICQQSKRRFLLRIIFLFLKRCFVLRLHGHLILFFTKFCNCSKIFQLGQYLMIQDRSENQLILNYITINSIIMSIQEILLIWADQNLTFCLK